MNTITEALLTAISKFELWDSSVLNEDAAVSAMEEVAAILQAATSEERATLMRGVQAKHAEAVSLNRPEHEIQFWDSLLSDLGIGAV